MSRVALLAGMPGGIMGTVAVVVCFIQPFIQIYTTILRDIPFTRLMYAEASTATIFITILFVVLLVVSCILTGVGFYGIYTVGGGAMGIVGLIFGIMGGAAAAILALLGSSTSFTARGVYYYFITIAAIPYYPPLGLWDWIGLIILGVSFVIMGCASIVVREYTMHSGTMVAAGILSIIGGSALIFISLWAGLALMFMFVAFLLWAIVFYTTKH
ncbi:MAG: hypothetical protein ACETWM_08860 [Candidatus Lokiarchaeia archaeon]